MLLHRIPRPARVGQRGAALLLSFLLIIVLIAILTEIRATTQMDARVARNDLTLTNMDLAVESALLQVAETLKSDADAAAGEAAGGAPAGAAGAPGAAAAGAAPGAPGGEGGSACDSRRDEWAIVQRTEINQVSLRILIQDEDSKYNILNMLNPDEKEAEEALERVTRILDKCRASSRDEDIDESDAEEMAKAMLEHLTKRKDSKLPRPKLLTDIEKNDDFGMPLSLREFMVLKPFEEKHFRDYRDADDVVVHSITSFLTVWSSVGYSSNAPSQSGVGAAASTAGTGAASSGNSNAKGSSSSTKGAAQATGGGGGTGAASSGGAGAAGAAAAAGAAGGAASTRTAGGFGVNVNTAPPAVLHSLFDGRDVEGRFWDRVVEYRNEEDEEEKKKREESKDTDEEVTPQLDEYGEEILKRNIFDSLSKLEEIDGWTELEGERQDRVKKLLTTTSDVFSVYVICRKVTSVDGDNTVGLTPQELRRLEETRSDTLVRVVRSVMWRHKVADEMVITPLQRWEVLDYLPYEVLDFPEEDR